MKSKRRSLIISIINALLIENLISLQQKEIFDLSLRRANLASKSDIANFVNKTNFDSKKRYINMMKDINESKTLSKYILSKCKFRLGKTKCN